jgi:hypothetical protein
MDDDIDIIVRLRRQQTPRMRLESRSNGLFSLLSQHV